MKKILFILIALIATTTVYSQLDTSYKPVNIVLEIPNTVKGETVLKRKAELQSMIYNTNDKTLSLVWSIKYYADTSIGYGQYLGSIIPDKVKITVANDNVMVNTTTGAFVYKDSAGNYPSNIKYIIGQYSFFNRIAQFASINVHGLIKQYGLQNDWSE